MMVQAEYGLDDEVDTDHIIYHMKFEEVTDGSSAEARDQA